MKGNKDQLRAALREMERVIADAAEAGAPVDRWVEQLVAELRGALPGERKAPQGLVHRILTDPDLSLVAQADFDPALVRRLKELIISEIR